MHHYCQTKHTHSFPMKIPLGVCGKVLLINILPVSSFLHLTAFFLLYQEFVDRNGEERENIDK